MKVKDLVLREGYSLEDLFRFYLKPEVKDRLPYNYSWESYDDLGHLIKTYNSWKDVSQDCKTIVRKKKVYYDTLYDCKLEFVFNEAFFRECFSFIEEYCWSQFCEVVLVPRPNGLKRA